MASSVFLKKPIPISLHNNELHHHSDPSEKHQVIIGQRFTDSPVKGGNNHILGRKPGV